MGWTVSVKLKGKFEIGQFGLKKTRKDKQYAIKDFEQELEKFLDGQDSYVSIATDGEIEAVWENE